MLKVNDKVYHYGQTKTVIAIDNNLVELKCKPNPFGWARIDKVSVDECQVCEQFHANNEQLAHIIDKLKALV